MGKIAKAINKNNAFILTKTLMIKKENEFAYKLIRSKPLKFYKVRRGVGILFEGKYGEIHSGIYPEMVIMEDGSIQFYVWGTDEKEDKNVAIDRYFRNNYKIELPKYKIRFTKLLIEWETYLFNSHG